MTHVLIVDDASTVRMYHRALLEEAGFAVTEAMNGAEALEHAAAADAPFELFVVDVNMPQMDGYSLMQALRADDRHAAVPAMMVTTEAEAGDRAQSLACGANAHLVKPVDAERFVAHATILAGRAAP